MGDVPRWYVPTYLAIKLTLWLLVWRRSGARSCDAAATRRPGTTKPTTRGEKKRRSWLLPHFFPLICEVIVRRAGVHRDAALFVHRAADRRARRGRAQWPALAGLKVCTGLRRPAAAAIVLLGLGWNATTLYRLHPDEYLFYNPLVGGLAGASRNYDTDYWVNMMPEAVSDLEHYLDRTEGKARPCGIIIWSRYAASGCNSRKRPTRVWNGRAMWIVPISSSRRRT